MPGTNKTPSGYDRPPSNILEVMAAPSPPKPFLSPTGDRLILVQSPNFPSIERLASPYLRLAGVRIEPHNHSRRDTPGGYGIKPLASSYHLLHIGNGTQIPIEVPENARLSDPLWSSDGKLFAFSNTTHDAVEIWIGDGQTGAVRRVPDVRLNPMLDYDFQWMADQETLVAKLVPNDLGPPPSKSGSRPAPNIQQSYGERGQSSTYEVRDTLTCQHDEDVFDYYAASQIAFIDAGSLHVQPVRKIDRYLSIDRAPDGKHLLVTKICKPYSYVTAFERFPRDVDVWDASDRSKIVVHHVASLPLADRVPIHGVPTAPRSFSWRQNAPAILTWAEALDGGDWKVDVSARDKIMKLEAPFDGSPTEIMRTEQRFSNFYWGEHPEVAISAEYDRNKQWRRGFLVNIDNPDMNSRLIWDLSMKEKYNDPGSPVRHRISNGAWVMPQDGNSIFFSGTGSSPDGDRPFLDKLDLDSLTTSRLFRSSKTSVERFYAFGSKSNFNTFLTLHQTPSDPLNVFRRTLQNAMEAGEGEAAFASESVAITQISDPTPIVRQIKKRLVSYERADGVQLAFKLYTPPGYQENARLPTLLYAYPLDYADPSVAGQTGGSENTFTKLVKHFYLLLEGYAIIDASFPIVGDPKSAYDTYLEQLVANAQAAVGEAVRLGVTDPQRVGVTGHSHGAFMTANLLAHSDLFRAGIATSGAYNKTVTPFGFQNERRSVWEAQEVYIKVSPYLAADKIKTPLLIMHGEDDANPGTTPGQSKMLYEAVRGNGGTTRLVMLPHEPHWYAAQESNEQFVYEMLSWMDKHVKG